MSTLPGNDAPVRFSAPGEITLLRTLPGPIERVWAHLTDPEKRSRWLAHGRVEPHVGGVNHLEFHHATLTEHPEIVPEKYAADCQDGCHFTGRVTRWEPPRIFAHTWPESDGRESEVLFELESDGDRVLLRLTHHRLGDDRDFLIGAAAGWHTHFAILLAKLAGHPSPPFWATHAELEHVYARLYAEATGD